MELLLLNTAQGLKPMYDEDYDEKKKLQLGKVYRARISVPRNVAHHRKYFSMINCAWDLLTEKARTAMGSKEAFRKTVQIAAGHCERVYSIARKEFIEVPKSISFDSMGQDEFEELYRSVRDIIIGQCFKHITIEQFEQTLMNY